MQTRFRSNPTEPSDPFGIISTALGIKSFLSRGCFLNYNLHMRIKITVRYTLIEYSTQSPFFSVTGATFNRLMLNKVFLVQNQYRLLRLLSTISCVHQRIYHIILLEKIIFIIYLQFLRSY